MKKILIIVPTYNEKNNIKILIKKIRRSVKNYKLLFIDDNSPDGTRKIIETYLNKNIHLINRNKRSGIGSAHKFGIKIGYKKKFEFIITMDCDGTHNPVNIKKMIKKMKNNDLVVTNRFLNKNSISDWTLFRKLLTHFRHFIIKFFLNIPYDSSGAFRCYKTKNIKLKDILLAKDNGYNFFWESMFVLDKKKYKISEIPIYLPRRITGSSKMRIKDIVYAAYYLFIVYINEKFKK